MTPKINWNPSSQDLRKFGLTILVGFGLIGFVIYRRGNAPLATSVWSVASAVAFLAIAIPPVSRPFYLIWMGLAFVLGAIMSRLVLSVIFLLVLTPVALFFRLVGRDALKRRKPKRPVETYWVDHPEIEDKRYYEHLF